MPKIKEGIERLLRCMFIRTTMYVDWLESTFHVIKNNGTLRVFIDFKDLNVAILKDEYPMSVAKMLVDSAAGFKYLTMLNDYSGSNQIFIKDKDVLKMEFRCLRALGTYEWIVLSFGLKKL